MDTESDIVTRENEIDSEFYFAIDNLGHKPAYIVVLNFDTGNEKHIERHLSNEANYANPPVGKNIMDADIVCEDTVSPLEQIAYGDGAVVCDLNNDIFGTNVMLKNVDWDKLAGADNGGNGGAYRYLGYRDQIGARQLHSVATPPKMKNTVLYTLGESCVVRRYAHDRRDPSTTLSYSTHPLEKEVARKRFKKLLNT
jgi:hypothetical protein